jgi:hypothetical protein
VKTSIELQADLLIAPGHLGWLGVALSSGIGVTCRDSNRVIFGDCRINTLPRLRGQILVASKNHKMLILVCAAALAHVASV